MTKPLEVPFNYGDVISITGSGNKVILWFKDPNSVIRGLLLDVTNPASPFITKDEVVIRRKTESHARKRKLPPIGQKLQDMTK